MISVDINMNLLSEIRYRNEKLLPKMRTHKAVGKNYSCSG